MNVVIGLLGGIIGGLVSSIIPGANIGLFYLLSMSMPVDMAIVFIVSADAMNGGLKCLQVLNPAIIGENDKIIGAVGVLLKAGYGKEIVNECFMRYTLFKLITLMGGIIVIALGINHVFNIRDTMMSAVAIIPGLWIYYCYIQGTRKKQLQTFIAVIVYGVVGYLLINMNSDSEIQAPMYTISFALYGIPSYFQHMNKKIHLPPFKKIKLQKKEREENKYGYNSYYFVLGLISALYWGIPGSFLSSLDVKHKEWVGELDKNQYGIKEIGDTYILDASSNAWGLIFCLGGIGARSAAASTISLLIPEFSTVEAISLICITIIIHIGLIKNLDTWCELYRVLINNTIISNILIIINVIFIISSLFVANSNTLFILIIGFILNKITQILKIDKEVSLSALSLIPLIGLL